MVASRGPPVISPGSRGYVAPVPTQPTTRGTGTPILRPGDRGYIDPGAAVFLSFLSGGGAATVGGGPGPVLNKSNKGAAKQQATVAALGSVISLLYGTVRPGALLCNVLVSGRAWVWWVIWGAGPISSYNSFTMNDIAVDPAIIGTHYLGTASQTVDPTLVAAFAAIPGMPAWTLALPGIAYSVFVGNPEKLTAMPKFNATVNGRALYDPRLDSTNGGVGTQRLATPSTWTFSRNPTLAMADFMVNVCGLTPVWSSVIANANANDTIVGTAPNTEVQRLCDYMVDSSQSVTTWLEGFRTAACCWLVPQGDLVKLIPDIAAASVATFDHASGQLLAVTGEQTVNTVNLPTVMEVTYRDATATPWRDLPVLAKRPGVDAGTTPWIQSTVAMPWITRASQANREAIERLNKIWLRSPTLNVSCMDEGFAQETGDVVTLNYPDSGYSNLPVRVLASRKTAQGWDLGVCKEDPGVYSGVVQAGPTVPTTNLPSPIAPPAPTGLTWIEELYQDATGRLKSRMRATWSDVRSTYPFFVAYKVEVYVGASIIDVPSTVGIPTFAWGPCQEGLTYTVNVYTLSAIAASPPVTLTTLAAGKFAKPSDVPYFFVYETAGILNFQWIASLDLDLASHEIRFGPSGTATWANATTIDFYPFPQRTATTTIVPPGSWLFFIKGRDALRTAAYPNGQESVNAASMAVAVKGNPGLFIAGRYSFTTPVLTNMVAVVAGGATNWVTDYGNTVAAAFPSTPLSTTYPNPMETYSGSGTSSLVTEAYDFGQVYSGSLIASITYTDIAGTAGVFIETSLDNLVWTQYVGTVALAQLRFVRLRVQTTGVVLVTGLGTVQLSVVALQESGSILTSAAGPVTVNLANRYTKIKTIQVTADVTAGSRNPGWLNPQFATDPRYVQLGWVDEAWVDEVSLAPCSFDVECWDGLNNQVANNVSWQFQGI